MPRSILDEAHIHVSIREKIARHESGIVEEVKSANKSIGYSHLQVLQFADWR